MIRTLLTVALAPMVLLRGACDPAPSETWHTDPVQCGYNNGLCYSTGYNGHPVVSVPESDVIRCGGWFSTGGVTYRTMQFNETHTSYKCVQ
jgi:hypothetical protein